MFSFTKLISVKQTEAPNHVLADRTQSSVSAYRVMAHGVELRTGLEKQGNPHRVTGHRHGGTPGAGKEGATGTRAAGLDLKGWTMGEALAMPVHKPAIGEAIRISMQQLDALANAISNIDSYKHFDPQQLPLHFSKGRYAIDAMWRNVLCPVKSYDLEIKTADLQASADCLKTMQDIMTGGQMELMQPIIETAHDLITKMAGDRFKEIYPGDDE
jgi:hypothetical protein